MVEVGGWQQQVEADDAQLAASAGVNCALQEDTRETTLGEMLAGQDTQGSTCGQTATCVAVSQTFFV